MTDPGFPAPETMYKRTRYALNQINRSLYGPKFWKRGKGVEYVIGLERQTRGSVHSHTIVRFPEHDINDPTHFSLRYWANFFNELGGWSKLERPNHSERTVQYVTKYVCKEGEIYLSETLVPSAPKAFHHTLLGVK
jgi:hypothetical protein